MYKGLAYVYDRLMEDVNYKTWAEYVIKIFEKNQFEPMLVLDLGCGTGSLCVEMAKMNYDMIGIDISSDMLSCARDKSIQEGLEILYIHQDMCAFELYGTVDAILCLMDSVNYVTNKNSLKKLFKLAQLYLNPNGLFIFDINTRYKLEQKLHDNVFYSMDEEISYLWSNVFDKKKSICEFDLSFFVKEGTRYQRFDETHYERAYDIEELSKMLNTSGFEVTAIYDELSFEPIKQDSERVFFVCKKNV